MSATTTLTAPIVRDDYPLSLTMREARDLYFRNNGFGDDGGYSAKWVDFKLGPVPFPFPNTAARIKAVKVHDLHHIVTGYRTNFVGELEISAWEIGGGCDDMVAAWVLNLGGMGFGFLVAPARTFSAFVRGRRGHTLYRYPYGDALLDKTVGELRTEVGADREDQPATTGDVLRAISWGILGFFVGMLLFWTMLPLVPIGIVVGNLARRSS
ncbi:MAG: hypothetical protein ACXVEE_09050 [Polyangiales bacterium]